MATTYWDYIRVEELLRLQGGLARDDAELTNHEVVFITVHQVFELWFKLILRELAALRDLFREDYVPEDRMAAARRGLDRITRILRLANQHWEVVESINTRDYLDFRDKLFPASGFQSGQMREMEILMGLGDDERVGLGAEGKWREALHRIDGAPSAALARVEARIADVPTLKEAVEGWLYRTPIRGSTPADDDDARVVDGFVADYLGQVRAGLLATMEVRLDARLTDAERDAARGRYRGEIASAERWLDPGDVRRRRIRAAILFIESYRALPMLSLPREILEGLVEVEQALLIFRQRHARMVERVIGRRTGTGGSAGVDYLDTTALSYRVFGDLWAVRTLQIPRDAAPPLENAGFYDFRAAR
jgi:tryptophan 2,3-dioxygenase